MPYRDNPAGRLHELLTRLAQQNHRASILEGWAAVLRVEKKDVVVHLGRVADLVRQTQDAVDRAGEEALLPPVQRYRDSWAQPIFPRDQAFSKALGNVLPDEAALEALNLVSAQLHSIEPEGIVPDEDELESLKVKLRDLIDEVQVAEDIPDEVKHLFISRLRAVEEAIEHLDVGGPSAIQHAMEAVVGSVFFTQDTGVAKSSTVRNTLTTLLVIWTAFSAGPTIQASLKAWPEIIPLLSAGGEQSTDGPVSHEAPPPSSPDSNGHDEDRTNSP